MCFALENSVVNVLKLFLIEKILKIKFFEFENSNPNFSITRVEFW